MRTVGDARVIEHRSEGKEAESNSRGALSVIVNLMRIALLRQEEMIRLWLRKRNIAQLANYRQS
jgi:hypothetical protein